MKGQNQLVLTGKKQSECSDEHSDEEGRNRYTFTVFTATYNRSHTLHRVYESLMAQTDRDFEWLIVDDGSTDSTRELIDRWRKTADFPIRYFYQSNRGKHTAYNLAAVEAEGEFLICLDSDDACVPTALERFRYHWHQIPPQERSRYSGVDCHCQDETGKIIGSWFPRDSMDGTASKIRYLFKVTGEKWGMQRTDVMREFPFPEDLEQKVGFLPESIIWSKMTKQYPVRYINECLRIYYEDNGADQLTKTKLPSMNPIGMSLLSKSILEVDIDYFRFSPKPFLKAAANYSRSSFHLRRNLWTQGATLNSGLGRLLWAVMLPIGFLLWVKDTLQK